MVTSLETTRRTVEAYAASQARIAATLLRVLRALWRAYPSNQWDNLDLRRAWAAESAVRVDIALAQTRALARGYMLTRLGQVDARIARLPEASDSYERGGVALTEVYERPARQREWVERSERLEGVPKVEAVAKAEAAFEERLEQVVAADIQLTARDEAQKVMETSPDVVGYRRIIHPERSASGTCGLCIVAADRLYTIKELMPIHDNCKCTVDVVTKTSDPGLALNRADLNEIYEAAGGNTRSELSQLRIKTVKHGELGPMLLRSGGKWVTPSQVNRRTNREAAKASPYQRQTRPMTQTNWRAMKATSERSIRYLLNAKSRGTDIVDLGTGVPTRVKDLDAAIQYHRDLIARAGRHAA